MDLTARLDAMEAAIKKPSFRQSSGKANEVNYWIFDYPPEKELEVRERIEYMKNKNLKGNDEYQLVVFDLYDIIIDFLERKNFVEKCCDFEKKRGFGRIVKAVSNSMKVSENDSLIVRYIQENTPENAHNIFFKLLRNIGGKRHRLPDRSGQKLSSPALPQCAE